MKQLTLYAVLSFMLVFSSCSKTKNIDRSVKPLTALEHNSSNQLLSVADPVSFKVLQFNTWQDGAGIRNLKGLSDAFAFDLIVNEIASRNPDFVTFSETQNQDSFYVRMTRKLKEKDLFYYGGPGNNTAVISKYPIIKYHQVYGTTFTRLLTTIKGREIAVYSGHLDYTRYACYYPRAYSPTTWNALPNPVTDTTTIRNMNLSSSRDEQIAAFIASARNDTDSGRVVILGGDFNEPSHLDWTTATKNLFDHNGVVLAWTTTLSLTNSGFTDTYRFLYPNEVTHPGFTWVYNKDWAPNADERDRIDYIFSSQDPNLTIEDGYIVGPDSSIIRHNLTKDATMDKFSKPIGIWPSDHKALMTQFSLSTTGVQTAITLDTNRVANGVPVHISFANGSTNAGAWIGIYHISKEPKLNYSDKWSYTGGQSSGSMTLSIPTGRPSGKYYVAYFKDDGYTEIAQRVIFTYGN